MNQTVTANIILFGGLGLLGLGLLYAILSGSKKDK